MPDGFTPVSVSLFDAQIDLIATRYSLHGTNVLTHCRGQFLSLARCHHHTHLVFFVRRCWSCRTDRMCLGYQDGFRTPSPISRHRRASCDPSRIRDTRRSRTPDRHVHRGTRYRDDPKSSWIKSYRELRASPIPGKLCPVAAGRCPRRLILLLWCSHRNILSSLNLRISSNHLRRYLMLSPNFHTEDANHLLIYLPTNRVTSSKSSERSVHLPAFGFAPSLGLRSCRNQINSNA